MEKRSVRSVREDIDKFMDRVEVYERKLRRVCRKIGGIFREISREI